MGIFTRRRLAAANGLWEYIPESFERIEGGDADMCDQGQAALVAFRVGFRLSAGIGSTGIAVWAYPVHGPAYPGTFMVGVRYQYQKMSGWSYDGYTGPAEPKYYARLERAMEAAREEADLIAAAADDIKQEYPEIFEWDGEPFPVVDKRAED